MQDRNATASSVFFTGVSLTIEPERLRQHFESVGHVVSFTVYGPAPGKDFRYGIVGYMDPQTAEEGIRRLNGTTFGERAMRVTAARSTALHGPARAGPGGAGSGPVGRPPFMKREREGYVPDTRPHAGPHLHGTYPSSSSPFPYGRGGRGGRGGGAFGGPPVRAPMMPLQPTPPLQPSVDKDGRELMQLPRTFVDPILGRDNSLVLNALRGMATEDTYAAVEQLRVLALERPSEAKLLLQNNPALKSAVVITLQHAGRVAPGPLPGEAYRAAKPVMEKEAEKADEEKQVLPTSGGAVGMATGATTTSPPSLTTTNAAAAAAAVPVPGTGSSNSAAPTSAPSVMKAAAPAAASAAPSRAAPAPVAAAAPVPMTAEERDEVLELIQNMSEEDVERVLTMSARDLTQIPDVAQRKQLEVLQRRLVEMSQDL